ncbi:hypothetical protein [Rhizobium terrae]|uniref:hypothetical protein n=1 Tax=Rhizobium terrae TaxID=2171756 RepID=UPI000E3CAF13|nr:hypothetical protein [Rhizobium terrae]
MSGTSQIGNSEQHSVALMLTGGKITAGFRSTLFSAANRSGMSVNEFVITAAAEKLKASGEQFPGVFRPGDLTIEGTAA